MKSGCVLRFKTNTDDRRRIIYFLMALYDIDIIDEIAYVVALDKWVEYDRS